MKVKLQGLVAATHTPFHQDGRLNLAIVEKQAEYLHRKGVRTVFVGGSTGEYCSMTLDERLLLAKRWGEVLRGTDLQLVVHVGSNCLSDACTLAKVAHSDGAVAIAALAPSYFKPKSVDVLVHFCKQIAQASEGLPFYFYDIPALTGVRFSMPAFLELGGKEIPNLAGIKYTNPDLMAYQMCLAKGNGAYDLPWGVDETLLAALALGAKGAVGSSYNFAAPLYQRLIHAFERGDMAAAIKEQGRSVAMIHLMAGYGYMAAAKALMGILGVNVGQPRLPNTSIAEGDIQKLRKELEAIGFFEWGCA